MFIDSSALTALLALEPDAARLAAAIEEAKLPKVASIVRLEAAMVLSTLLGVTPKVANVAITQVFEDAAITVVPLGDAIMQAAVEAFEMFGKGRGHPARLNFGDCLVYAAARIRGDPLLSKGNDFTHTDIKSVLEDPLPIQCA
ncbi:type II toxin-antitoxin system VapC family toxin [Aquidulcibacter sp.]|jgi:ribonuclease VapC|uniref:type II toxin-antitoxin system VapC family toxin n=1 Tax=Aquidulcibacter sp. TaxID=2052990 RepID=UPI0028ACBCCB|nr:type II toxin-antitoxin system VapC family toxin [Aquidulcibacter sp.]